MSVIAGGLSILVQPLDMWLRWKARKSYVFKKKKNDF